ncbi:MAG TPA: FG-GAP repeat protein, partial [Anaerolineales bacterium]|nr:FG-GAP repeat protein [Anaerolineales bacterium]
MHRTLESLIPKAHMLLTGALVFASLAFFMQPAAARAARPVAPAPETRLGAFQVARLAALRPEPLDEFGWAVALSGDTAAVGAHNADPDLGQGAIRGAGAVDVFARSTGAWAFQSRLTARNAAAGDTFGASVTVDGGWLAVGAPGVDVEEQKDAGAVYIFRREGAGWKQQARLLAPDSAKEDSFGGSLALQGDTLVVGAPGKDLGFLVDAGAAYVFVLRGTSWDLKSRLLAPDPSLGANFGSAVALSGPRAVVGALEANPLGERGAGAAYVFTGRGNAWRLEARLAPEPARPGDFFGQAVAIDGETVVVGA